tara:strand:+ start:506 stop:1075 length:570 start_codon:yes stop_codon:yes gene_type:complete
MATERQIGANRANAQHSTGPTTTLGKRKVARNARRHGLTTPLPWDQVTRWYRIIKNDVAALPDLASRDPYDQAALRLAEAEAQLDRVMKAERDHLLEMQRCAEPKYSSNRSFAAVTARGSYSRQDEELFSMAESLKDDEFLSDIARFLIRSSPVRPVALRKTMATLTRYRRDAESAHRSALRAWIKIRL